MDIFAHALWTNILARTAQARAERRHKTLLKIWWATFWGIFPDLFAFTAPFLIGIWDWISGIGFEYGRETITAGLAPLLYNYSHSLVIWLFVFFIVWFMYKRPRWELLGWALHIFIDIPSHANGFYLTPVFFPLSDWKFIYGISWANPRYMAINYSALVIVSIIMIIQKRKNSISNKDISFK